MNSIEDKMWEFSTIKDYKQLDSNVGWEKCPKCNKLPRTWIFDNGSYAKCCCGWKYEKPQAESESIMSVYRRTGGTLDYSENNLRLAWNEYVENIKLEKK